MNQPIEDIKHSISIDASMAQVWNHISTARSLSEWFMPNDLVAQLGYVFHLQSLFGPSPCTGLNVQPEKELPFSWDADG